MSKKKILVLVEGEKSDVKLMEKLLSTYGIDAEYEIVSYKTNIYTLYASVFDEYGGSYDIDLLQLLKSKETNPDNYYIFEQRYTDTILVFDLDPQAPDFSFDKITSMCRYFDNSSDSGKLYINFPMVESFYHMRTVPDPDFDSYSSDMAELLAGKYKQRVHNECRDGDYKKFAKARDECSIVIAQNIRKAQLIVDGVYSEDLSIPEIIDILESELDILRETNSVSVLCTCAFFIPEYDPALLTVQ